MVKKMKKKLSLFMLLGAMLNSVGCSTEVGSEEWCKELKQKPKLDWTNEEVKDFTKHCLI